MTTIAEPMTAEQRRQSIKDIARAWDGIGETVRALAVASLVSPSLAGRELEQRWDEFRGELALLDGLNGLPWAAECSWSDVNDELTGCGRTEAARDEMEMRVAGALDALVNGTAAGSGRETGTR